MAALATAEWDFTDTVNPGGNTSGIVSFAWKDQDGEPIIFPAGKYFVKQAEFAVNISIPGETNPISGGFVSQAVNWDFWFDQGFVYLPKNSGYIQKQGSAYSWGFGRLTTSINGDYIISIKVTEYGDIFSNTDKVYIYRSVISDKITATIRFTGRATVYSVEKKIN